MLSLDFSNDDFVIVGSGPTGVSAASVALETGRQVTLIDGGISFDLGDVANRQPYRALSDTPKKLFRGSDFATRKHPRSAIHLDDSVGGSISSSVGGLSNIWGASLFPFRRTDLRGWPLTESELDSLYESVLREIPHSGGENWSHELVPKGMIASKTAADASICSRFHDIKPKKIRGFRVEIVDSLLAVDNKPDSATGCAQCGLCLSGCPNNSIYSSAQSLRRLIDMGVNYQSGLYVTNLEELSDYVVLRGFRGDRQFQIRCKRVLLAAGPIVSTALVLDALRRQTAILHDCQAFTIPLLLVPQLRFQTSTMSLPTTFVEVLDSESDRSIAHLQIYGRGPEFVDAVTALIRPSILRKLGQAKLLSHLLAAHGFLRPSASGSVLINRIDGSGPTKFVASATAPRDIKRTIRSVCRAIRQQTRQIGVYPIGSLAHLEKPGGSYHLATSFPVSKSPDLNSSDLFGRPNGLKRIHLVDASSLPEVPPQSPTLTAMAHASVLVRRIVSEQLV